MHLGIELDNNNQIGCGDVDDAQNCAFVDDEEIRRGELWFVTVDNVGQSKQLSSEKRVDFEVFLQLVGDAFQFSTSRRRHLAGYDDEC